LLDGFESGERDFPSDRFRINVLGHVSEAAALALRAELAGKLYDKLLPEEGVMFDCGSPAFVLGPVGRPLGMLASLLERWDAADAHFEAAIRAAENMQHRPAVADTTFEHARSLVSRGHWNERSRARDMAEFAEAEAQSMGYARLELDAAKLLESMGRGGYPAGLSEREVGVLRLVARGLSNREIGEELVVSPATVATHLRHIFSKTGSANRAQAVAFAVSHELT
jgi:DNA-binding CsgD family transcriptional regulator